MIEITYRTDQAILRIHPVGPLGDSDFDELGSQIDRLRKESKDLQGILVQAKQFPGYERLSDAIAHGAFVEEYGDKVKKIALCTDSTSGKLLGNFADHFTNAETRAFDHDDRDEAEKWILSGSRATEEA